MTAYAVQRIQMRLRMIQYMQRQGVKCSAEVVMMGKHLRDAFRLCPQPGTACRSCTGQSCMQAEFQQAAE